MVASKWCKHHLPGSTAPGEPPHQERSSSGHSHSTRIEHPECLVAVTDEARTEGLELRVVAVTDEARTGGVELRVELGVELRVE